jgi:3-dehydroquinate dehydratase I
MSMRIGKKPLLVACVATEGDLRRCARRAPGHCDALEVRLDLVGPCGGDWPELCAAAGRRGRPVLLTVRSAREGGAWRGTETERLALYAEGLRRVSAVDAEIGSDLLPDLVAMARRARATVVGSYHDFEKTPPLETLREVEARGRRLGADVVKIAAKVRAPADLATLFALPALADGPLCVLGMGDLGAIARVALPCAGSCLAYGSLGAPTAPGQLSCRRLASELRCWKAREP